jgi:hypothetical protein
MEWRRSADFVQDGACYACRFRARGLGPMPAVGWRWETAQKLVGRIDATALAGITLSLALLVACEPETPPTTTTGPVSTTVAPARFSGSDTSLAPAQLETLVGPIALYSDDLLALVLPASTQPLQVVEAQRFLEARKTNPSLQPSKNWDPSVVALLNYPEALARMNTDLTWLQQLGTSVVHQQAGVMDAVQSFRKKVLDAGNLKSDDKQNVAVQSGGSGAPQVIVIESANPQVIYVPTYEPTTIVYAAAPGYPYPYYPYYWSAPYPYYYNPAAPFFVGASFGVAVGFGCSWDDHDIYRGDIDINRNVNINRDELRQRAENRQNSDLANQIRRNPENVWRPDRSGLDRAQAASGAASSLGRQDLADRTPRTDVGGNRPDRAPSSGAFSDIDRGAAANRFSDRGRSSMGGGYRGGGGFRGGGGRGGGGRR